MKKQLSVFGLCLCRMKKTLIPGMILIPVVNLLSYFIVGLIKGTYQTAIFPGDADLFYSLIFTAVLMVCLTGTANDDAKKNTKCEYFLKRLCVSERSIFFWSWAAASLEFLIMYLMESLALTLTAYFNSLRKAFIYGPQGIFAQLVASSFAGSLTIYTGPVTIAKWCTVVVIAGLLCAYLQLSVIRGKKTYLAGAYLWIVCMITHISASVQIMAVVFVYDGFVFVITLLLALRRLKTPATIEKDDPERRSK